MAIPADTFGLGNIGGGITTITKQPHDYQIKANHQQGVAGGGAYEDGLPDLEVIYHGGMDEALHQQIMAFYQTAKTTNNFKVQVRYWHKTESTTKTQVATFEFPEHRDMAHQLIFNTKLIFRRVGQP